MSIRSPCLLGAQRSCGKGVEPLTDLCMDLEVLTESGLEREMRGTPRENQEKGSGGCPSVSTAPPHTPQGPGALAQEGWGRLREVGDSQ